MAVFTESFNKADGALGPDLTWAPQVLPSANPWEVTSNAASPRGAVRGLVEYARAEHDTAGSDIYAEVDITALLSGSQGGPCVRFTTATDATCYFLEIFGDGHVQIQKVVAGIRTNLLSQPVTIGTLPGRLRLEVAGSTLTAFWRGVQVAQTTDTDIAAGTRGGLAGFEGTGQGLGVVVDNFEVGDLGPVAPNQGTAAFGMGLELAATGSRASAGAAGLGMGLELAATGSRPSAGAAGLGLGLQLSATGSRPSQGDAHFTIGLDLVALSSVTAIPDLAGAVTVQGLSGSMITNGLSGTASVRGLAGTVT